MKVALGLKLVYYDKITGNVINERTIKDNETIIITDDIKGGNRITNTKKD